MAEITTGVSGAQIRDYPQGFSSAEDFRGDIFARYQRGDLPSVAREFIASVPKSSRAHIPTAILRQSLTARSVLEVLSAMAVHQDLVQATFYCAVQKAENSGYISPDDSSALHQRARLTACPVPNKTTTTPTRPLDLKEAFGGGGSANPPVYQHPK